MIAPAIVPANEPNTGKQAVPIKKPAAAPPLAPPIPPIVPTAPVFASYLN